MSRPPQSPQLEHGHTRIANAILEAMARYPFRRGECRVVMAILRLTYGWRTKAAPISARQLAKATGFSSRHAKRLLRALVGAGVLLRSKQGRRNVLGLNKRFWEWQVCTTSAHGDTVGPSQGTPPVPCERDTRCPSFKETEKKFVVKKAADPVHSFLEDALRRPLTSAERQTVSQLQAMSSTEANGLLQQMCKSRNPAL